MEEATHNELFHPATEADALLIVRFLNLYVETVWKTTRGMKYSSYAELEMAVHKAFLARLPPRIDTNSHNQVPKRFNFFYPVIDSITSLTNYLRIISFQ